MLNDEKKTVNESDTLKIKKTAKFAELDSLFDERKQQQQQKTKWKITHHPSHKKQFIKIIKEEKTNKIFRQNKLNKKINSLTNQWI